MPEKYEFHVISNTHWDREWRYPFQETRMHLVELMDWLLELFEKYPDYRHFHLDSQTIPLEDYLEIRPEKRELLKRHIAAGRLLVGPWYTLPEMNTVSGEAIVRNLLRGHKIANEFGAVMKIGYTPTSYGQLSQIAQIYAGFQIDGMMFYRGIVRDECATEYILEAPDGSRILGLRLSAEFSRASFWLHLARATTFTNSDFAGYYQWGMGMLPFRRCDRNAGELDFRLLKPTPVDFFNPGRLDRGMKSIRTDIATDATTPFLVAMDGMDSVFPHPNTVRVIDYCNQKNTGDVFIHSSFPQVIEKIKAHVDWSKLKVLWGERRHPSPDNWFNRFLKDNISTRLYQKQMNARVQTLLEKWAEPLAVFTSLLGSEYPAVYLDLAWKYLLSNHPHDSITGVSLDTIHQDLRYRWNQAEQIGAALTNLSLATVVRHLDLTRVAEDQMAVVAFNPLNYVRKEILEIELDFPETPKHKALEIIDAVTQAPVPFQLQSRHDWGTLVTSPFDIPYPFFTRRFQLAFKAAAIPASGYRTFIVRSKPGELVNFGTLLTAPNVMENESLRVEINPNGTFHLTHKISGREFKNLHFFEDEAEAGDPWTHISPLVQGKVSSFGSAAQIRVVEAGPLQTTFQIDLEMSIPKSLAAGKQQRSEIQVQLPISSRLTLRQGLPRLDIETTFDNQAWDHRLFAVFPTYLQTNTVDSEAAFDVVTRNLEIPDTRDWVEPVTGTQPHLSFVDVSDQKVGLALISHGLVEYEVQDDTPRTLRLTLVKGVRYPRVGLPPERVERLDQVGSQCPGQHTVAYALYPHTGNWETGRVFEMTYRHFTPLKAVQCGHTTGELPLAMSFLQIEPESLILSAVKKCEFRDTVIVRFFNPAEKDLHGKIQFWKPIKHAWLTNLNEERQQDLPVAADGALSLPVGHKKIITLELAF
ncbi:glycosyl hydrolase-related protein [candidate division KSB1 bacterium]|nr:glycosyl hydrolase-related protein [candidate division KSB1 bacterium]